MSTPISELKNSKKPEDAAAVPEEGKKTEAPAEAKAEAKSEEKPAAMTDEASQGAEKKKTDKPWWMSGEQAKVAAQKEYEVNRHKPFRFWLKPEEDGEIIFLDDEGFAFWEHELKIGGKWGNFVTCLRGVDPKGCPICKHRGRADRYLITLRTIIDLRGYTTKQGETREWSTRVLPAKDKVNKLIERRRKARGTLIGSKFTVIRTEAKSPRCGDDFEFIEEVDLSPFKYKDQKGDVIVAAPYEYQKIYEPLDYETVKSMIVEAEVDEDESGKDLDQDVPF